MLTFFEPPILEYPRGVPKPPLAHGQSYHPGPGHDGVDLLKRESGLLKSGQKNSGNHGTEGESIVSNHVATMQSKALASRSRYRETHGQKPKGALKCKGQAIGPSALGHQGHGQGGRAPHQDSHGVESPHKAVDPKSMTLARKSKQAKTKSKNAGHGVRSHQHDMSGVLVSKKGVELVQGAENIVQTFRAGLNRKKKHAAPDDSQGPIWPAEQVDSSAKDVFHYRSIKPVIPSY